MSASARVFAVIIVVIAAGLVLLLKQRDSDTSTSFIAPGGKPTAADTESATGGEDVQAEDVAAPQSAALPRFVELGSVTCIPCKMMAPILEELRNEYPGALHVEFIDLKEDPDSGMFYGVRVMPTQILYDADGVEIFRHEGFFPKEDILAKFKEMGVPLTPTAAPQKE